VHRADKLHRGDDVACALRRELRSGKDIVVEQLDLIAAELLNVLAANTGGGLREHLDG